MYHIFFKVDLLFYIKDLNMLMLKYERKNYKDSKDNYKSKKKNKNHKNKYNNLKIRK